MPGMVEMGPLPSALATCLGTAALEGVDAGRKRATQDFAWSSLSCRRRAPRSWWCEWSSISYELICSFLEFLTDGPDSRILGKNVISTHRFPCHAMIFAVL